MVPRNTMYPAPGYKTRTPVTVCTRDRSITRTSQTGEFLEGNFDLKAHGEIFVRATVIKYRPALGRNPRAG